MPRQPQKVGPTLRVFRDDLWLLVVSDVVLDEGFREQQQLHPSLADGPQQQPEPLWMNLHESTAESTTELQFVAVTSTPGSAV